MIVGVDHIALSCADLDTGMRTMSMIGFETIFAERDAPNREEKRGYLRQFQEKHSLAMCRSSIGPAMELTAHGLPEGIAPFQLLLQGVRGSSAAQAHPDACVIKSALGVRAAESINLADVGATAWVDLDTEGPPAIRAVMLAVRDLDRSKRFWCDGIGGCITHEGREYGRWALLEIHSPLPRCRLTVLLTEREHDESRYLDAGGFPCLALLVTQLSNDRQRMLHAGGQDPSADFFLSVNGRSLVIALLRGPDMEIIELIQLSQEARS